MVSGQEWTNRDSTSRHSPYIPSSQPHSQTKIKLSFQVKETENQAKPNNSGTWSLIKETENLAKPNLSEVMGREPGLTRNVAGT